MNLAIETRGLTKRLGGKPVVRDLDLRVPEGSIFGFLGPNGAGKTTAMRLLLGLLRPDAGDVRLLGSDFPKNRIALLGQIGAFIETHGLYEQLSGRANLAIACRLRGLDPSEIEPALDMVSMRHAADRRVRSYSLGMKQRMALARALLGRPKLLLLDEPTNGLDPDGIMAMRELIRDLPSRLGATVFLSSHLLGEVEAIATDIALLRKGELLHQGPLADFAADHAVLRIGVERPEDAVSLLASNGIAAEIEPGTAHLLVRLAKDGARPASADAAGINTLLVREGFPVSLLKEDRRGLEDLYRDMIGPVGTGEGDGE